MQSHPSIRPHKVLHVALEYLTNTDDDLMELSLSKDLKIMKKLRIPAGTKSLRIHSSQTVFSEALYIREDFRKALLKLLKEFRKLKSLKISWVKFSDLPIFRKSFRRFRGLENLEIAFTRSGTETDKNCPRDFIKAFSSKLTQLRLRYGYSMIRPEDSDPRFQLKNCRIDRLNNLQNLALELSVSSFVKEKNSSIKYFDLSPLKNFNKLQSLEIAPLHWPEVDRIEIDTRELYFDPNKVFPNLKRLTWKVPHGKEFEFIGLQIALQLKNLTDFGFGMHSRGVKVEIQDLSYCLAVIQTDLSQLYFEFNCEQVSKQDAETLISELLSRKLRKLNALSLGFGGCKGITNRFLGDLAQVCATNFTRIKSLKLSFEPPEQENGKIISTLQAVFGYEGISDLGINNFAINLSKGCGDLQSLSLKFKNNWTISNSGVMSLCQKLNKLKKLRTVWIKFHNCWAVTNEGCKKAAKVLDTPRQVHVIEWRDFVQIPL